MWLWRVSLHCLTARFLFLARVEVFKVDYLWTCISPRSSLSKEAIKLNSFLLTHLVSWSPPWELLPKLWAIVAFFLFFGRNFEFFYFIFFLLRGEAKQATEKRAGRHPPPQKWEGGKMAALASSLIRQKRAVKDDQANRPVANKRKPCPKSNKSLCQKQILVLISKVRLCGGRKGRNEKRPGESQLALLPLSSGLF